MYLCAFWRCFTGQSSNSSYVSTIPKNFMVANSVWLFINRKSGKILLHLLIQDFQNKKGQKEKRLKRGRERTRKTNEVAYTKDYERTLKRTCHAISSDSNPSSQAYVTNNPDYILTEVILK